MAQGDLLKLIQRAEKYIGKDTEWYRSFLDLHTHQFTMTAESVLRAIRAEIGEENYQGHKKDIIRLAKIYVSEVYSEFKKKTSVILNFNGDENGFTVTITAKDPGKISGKAFRPTKNGPQLYYKTSGTNVFRHINDAKRGPQQKLVSELNAVLRATSLSSDSFIDTGHDIGVAEKQTRIGLANLSSSIRSAPQVAEIAAREARLEILSKFERGSKKFIVSVVEESAQANRSKATDEKVFKAQTLTLLRKFIQENKDWASQGGSDSQKEYIRKTLINSVLANGGKGKKLTIDIKPSKVSNKIKGKSTTSRSVNQESLKVEKQKQTSPISLLPLLNANLSSNVKAQMVKPSLVNRTGTFADSVKVVNITRSPQGFLVLDYDYDRHPYDVFDPVLGTSPWNTSARDPKKIIQRAIRTAAKGLIKERFYNRRVA